MSSSVTVRSSGGAEPLTRLITEANALALVGSHEHGIEVQVELDPECR